MPTKITDKTVMVLFYFVLGSLRSYRKDIRRSKSGFAVGKTTEKNLNKNHFWRPVRQK